MAFLTLEDLMGTVEVIVFPREFNKYQHLLKEDAKIFVKGNTSISEEESKMVSSQITVFDDTLHRKSGCSLMIKTVFLQNRTVFMTF